MGSLTGRLSGSGGRRRTTTRTSWTGRDPGSLTRPVSAPPSIIATASLFTTCRVLKYVMLQCSCVAASVVKWLVYASVSRQKSWVSNLWKTNVECFGWAGTGGRSTGGF